MNQSPEPASSESAANGSPDAQRKVVGVYDRPAGADRPRSNVVMIVVVVVAVVVAAMYFVF